MNIWGKVIGTAAGLALGGPLGALLGGLAGHLVDRYQAASPDAAGQDATREVAFTIAAIALGAKMAKADGDVSEHEVAVFRRIFRVAPEEERNLTFVFNLAKRSTVGFEGYAKQIARLLADRPVLLEELLGGLFMIAVSDGVLHPREKSYLRCVAEIFGFDAATYERVRAAHVGEDDRREDDPYRILGLDPGLDDAALKAGWRRLVRENHPDALIAKGLPDEFVAIATAKLARINAAWDRVASARGIA